MPRINFIYFILLFLTGVLVAPKVEASGASLTLSPLSGSFVVGDKISVDVKIDTGGTPINAVQAVISFPIDNLEVLDISRNDSVFSLWPGEPVFDNLKGEVSFAGGLPHPGFNEPEKIITIEFKAKKEGTFFITFDRAQVLADDGQGTDILAYLKSAKYSVFQEIVFPIFSSTHPNQSDWYNNNNPSFQWNLTPDIIGVSFVLDQNEKTIPEAISDGKIQSKDYENIPNGIWYFHLRRQNENGWQEPVHYKVQIDDVPPHSFEIVVDNAGDPTNPKPNLYFETNDDISGVSHYKIKIDKDSFINLLLAQVNPFSLSAQSPGQHQIVVRAVDQAGNDVETKTVLDIVPIASPQITLWPQLYISGEEVLYLEGKAPANAEVTIFLKKNGQDFKKWQTLSNNLGEWFFSTKELVKSGTYDLSAQAKDKRGALSDFSATYQMAVSFRGLSLGLLVVSFKTLAWLLLSFLFFGVVALGFFIYRINVTKKILRKETQEAQESLRRVFSALRAEVKERVELFDLRPGFNKQEKKVYDDLSAALDISEEVIQKEIKDIDKELE